MTSLTDRYVAATLRAIPPRQRAEIEPELRAAIADAVESTDEASALVGLGDPAVLAAGYSERPLQLIGPALYLDYRRVLVTLLSTVVPIIFLALAVTGFRVDAGLGPAVATAASTALLIAMHIAIWTTVVFAAIERRPGMRPSRARWSPAALPEIAPKHIDLGAVIGGSAVSAVIAAVLIVLQATTVGVIDPVLWNSGALLVVVVFAAVAIAFDVVGYYSGWGLPQAFANLALSLLFTGVVVVVARTGLLNPAFFDSIGWPGAAGPDGLVTWIVVIVVVLLGISNVATGFRRTRPSTTH